MGICAQLDFHTYSALITVRRLSFVHLTNDSIVDVIGSHLSHFAVFLSMCLTGFYTTLPSLIHFFLPASSAVKHFFCTMLNFTHSISTRPDSLIRLFKCPALWVQIDFKFPQRDEKFINLLREMNGVLFVPHPSK